MQAVLKGYSHAYGSGEFVKLLDSRQNQPAWPCFPLHHVHLVPDNSHDEKPGRVRTRSPEVNADMP